MVLKPPHNITEIETDLDRLFVFVDSAKDLISQGRHLDISDLQLAVADLCGKIETMHKRDARPFLRRLESLFERIAELEKQIDHQNNSEKENLQFSASHANPLYAQEAGRSDEDEPSS